MPEKLTKEDKELLTEDLKARIGTDTKVRIIDDGYVMVCKLTKDILPFVEDWDIHPYLRPMESMTEEEKKSISKLLNREFYVDDEGALVAEDGRHRIDVVLMKKYINFLDKNDFDHRGLIEKGLALVAPKDMYKTK